MRAFDHPQCPPIGFESGYAQGAGHHDRWSWHAPYVRYRELIAAGGPDCRAMVDELRWDAPGPGDWWLVLEHFPNPVSRMFASLFPQVTIGWKRGGARYGLATGEARWGVVNGWIYYGPEIPLDAHELAAREAAAQITLTSSPWRDEVRRWDTSERPRVVESNRALQRVDPSALTDDALCGHFQATVDNFLQSAPLHFEHTGFDVVAGLLFAAGAEAGLTPAEITSRLAGASPATAAVDAHVQRISDALDRAGARTPIASVEEMRAVGAEAAEAIDAYLDDYGWRPVAGHDVLEPTIGERSELVTASVNARRSRSTDRMRSSSPPAATGHEEFDALLSDARASYALRDDDVGVCWNWPLGLVRRAALEIGARAFDRGLLQTASHVFETGVAETAATLSGTGPSSAELARRCDVRSRAADAKPPAHLDGGGDRTSPLPLPPTVAHLTARRDAIWSAGPEASGAPLHGVGIGTRPAVGVARFVRNPDELTRLVDGDVLVAITTTTAFNAVFPLLAAVVTEHGGLFSHTAILARELDLPAVVGVSDLFTSVRDGQIIEVDPAAGTVRVVGPEP